MTMHADKRRFFIPFFILLALAAFSGVVLLLWNAIIPDLTGWSLLTYPKAVGLLVLCKILFGGFGRHGGHGGAPWAHHRHMRERWTSMSDEERAEWKGKLGEWRSKWREMSEEDRLKMRDQWKQRCGPWTK